MMHLKIYKENSNEGFYGIICNLFKFEKEKVTCFFLFNNNMIY